MPPSLHPSVAEAMSTTTSAIDMLAAILPDPLRSYPALALQHCAHTKCIIAPSHDLLTTPHPNFGAPSVLQKRQPPCPDILALCSLLVGVLSSNLRGDILISLNNVSVPIVLAPPPSPDLYGACVYISDWRYLPSGHFEALIKHLHPLSPTRPVPNFQHISSSISSSKSCDLLTLAGIVSAKSCIFGPAKPMACFFVELESPVGALTLVFRDKAVKWWPFIHFHSAIAVTHLRISVLRSYGNRRVLRASGDPSTVYSVPETDRTQIQPPTINCPTPSQAQSAIKRRRLEATDRLVTYKGNVTDVHRNATFTLDDAITMHLGPFHPYSVASTVRKGAVIELQAAVLYRSPNSIFLFPTVRSVLVVHYFGDIACRPVKMLQKLPTWRLFWKRWRFDYISWAYDLFDTLTKKFGDWLCAHSSELDDIFLGTTSSTGLVQYVMYVHTGLEESLNISSLPSRNLYFEFLDPLSICKREVFASFAPTIRSLHVVIDQLWREFVLKSEAKEDNVSKWQNLQTVFTASELCDCFFRRTHGGGHRSRVTGSEVGSIAVLGHLQSQVVGEMGLMLSDDTGDIYAICTGCLEPSVLEAIISVQVFEVIVESRVACMQSKDISIVFGAENVKVVVDGPYVEMCGTRDEIGAGTNGTRQGRWHEQASMQLSQLLVSSSLNGDEVESCEFGVTSAPLICIFVEEVRRGRTSFTLVGRLLAFRRKREYTKWRALDVNGEGFWRCTLLLKGEWMMKLIAVFCEGNIFGVSCSELSGKADIELYICRKGRKMLERGNSMVLVSNMSSERGWVECFGANVQNVSFEIEEEQAGTVRTGVDEKEMGAYVAKAVGQFTELGEKRIMSRLWRVYDRFDGKGWEKDMKVNMRGYVVGYCEEKIERNRRGDEMDGNDTVSRLHMIDNILGMYDLCILFYGKWRPRGIAVGMKVCVRNAVRMGTHDGYFMFVGDVRTHVMVQGGRDMERARKWEHGMEYGQSCDWRWIFDEIGECFISELWLRKDGNGKVRKASGIIRVRWIVVEDLRVHAVRRWSKGIESARENEIRMIGRVEDGSSECIVICEGLKRCEVVLQLKAEEVKKLEEFCRGFSNLGEREVSIAEQEDGELHELLGGRKSDVHMAVVARNGAYEDETNESVVMGRFGKGFGTSIWTARRIREKQLELKAVAVMEMGGGEGRWGVKVYGEEYLRRSLKQELRSCLDDDDDDDDLSTV